MVVLRVWWLHWRLLQWRRLVAVVAMAMVGKQNNTNKRAAHNAQRHDCMARHRVDPPRLCRGALVNTASEAVRTRRDPCLSSPPHLLALQPALRCRRTRAGLWVALVVAAVLVAVAVAVVVVA